MLEAPKDINLHIGDKCFEERIFSNSKEESRYFCRLANNISEVEKAQKLRYEVFNLELKEGLPGSHLTGLDMDRFDSVCDHLLVFETTNPDRVVGTYRLQPGNRAKENLGYYSEEEFDLSPLEKQRGEIIELGRACIDVKHRNLRSLGVLWRAIGEYAKIHQGRYLIGCSSLTSQDESVGASAYEILKRYLAEPDFRVKPHPQYVCSLGKISEKKVKIPRLLSAYMSIGAKICGEPAIDRVFKTIDFLTVLDLKKVSPVVFSMDEN